MHAAIAANLELGVCGHVGILLGVLLRVPVKVPLRLLVRFRLKGSVQDFFEDSETSSALSNYCGCHAALKPLACQKLLTIIIMLAKILAIERLVAYNSGF